MFEKTRVKASLYVIDTELLRIQRFPTTTAAGVEKAIKSMIEEIGQVMRLTRSVESIFAVIESRTGKDASRLANDIGTNAVEYACALVIRSPQARQHSLRLDADFEKLTGAKPSRPDDWITKSARIILEAAQAGK